MWAAIGLGLKVAGGGIWRFLRGIPWQLHVALAALILILVAYGIHKRQVKAAHDTGYSEGVTATKDAFARAQAKADAAQRAHIAKTVIKQTAISQESTNALAHSYATIDDRAHAISVRHDARQRAAGPSALPASGDPTSPAQCQAAADGLPWGVALPLMTQAAKNLAQLNAVLDWEAKQDALAKQEPTP